MGSPARRLTNPITRCRDQPHYRYAGTDDGRGTDPGLDTERLTLMSGCRYGGMLHDDRRGRTRGLPPPDGASHAGGDTVVRDPDGLGGFGDATRDPRAVAGGR